MNATIFWRIFWKEYRTQRAFWISMAMLVLVVELLLREGYRHFHPYPYSITARIQVLFAAGLGMGAFYALASGATLFAAEREAETYDFLRGLPVRPLAVFAAKATFALGSSAAFYLLAWSVALGLARGLPEPLFHVQIWALCGLGGIELLAWGVLFSLLLKRTLVAVICALTITSAMLWICGLLWIFVREPGQLDAVNVSLKTVPARLFLVALLVVTDIALASRWLSENFFSPDQSRLSKAQVDTILDQFLPAKPNPPTPASTMLGRLVWQEFRQSATISAGLLAMLFPWVLCVCVPSIHSFDPVRGGWYWFLVLFPMLLLPGYFSVPLLGSSVFLADQMGCRFRFLAEPGIPPRLVWLSRQIRGVLVMLVGLLLVLLVFLIKTGSETLQPDSQMVIAALAGFAIVGYACGQLCSMGIRSGILAAAFGTILTYVLCGWAAIMYWLCLNWLWSVAPMLVAFLFATWLHAPNWLAERKSWAARGQFALVIALPLLSILVAIPLVRVYEIPLVSPGFDVKEFARPLTAEQEETLALYQRAFALERQAAANEAERQNATEQAMTLAMEASRRPFPGPFLDRGTEPDPAAIIELADLLVIRGKKLQSDGKLDAALDRYLAAARIASGVRRQVASAWEAEVRAYEQIALWAAQVGQTPQRVLDALRMLENQWHDLDWYRDGIKQGYLRSLGYLQGDFANGSYGYEFIGWLPWERARALRILNQLTAEDLARYAEFETQLATTGVVGLPSPAKVTPELQRDFTYQRVRGWVRPLNSIRVDGRDVDVGHLGNLLWVENYRRATRLILAIEAWKLEHGRLPKSLEDLKGKYPDQLPIDPYTGGEFDYEPKGRPYYIVSSTTNSAQRTLEPGRPFIACDTWSAELHESSSNNFTSPCEERPSNGAAPKTEIWKGVWVFPIP